MPMSPEWLPETGFLLAGIFCALVAIHLLRWGHLRRGLKFFGLGVALMLLGTFLGTSSWTHEANRNNNPSPGPFPPLLPRTAVHATDEEDGDTTSTTILLGTVFLRAAASERTILSFERRPFLTLERHGPGLVVSCEAGDSLDRVLVRIRRNTIQYRSMSILKRDPHTIRIPTSPTDSTDLFSILYADPRRIEVMGRFYPEGRDTAIVLTKGIHWPGGGAPPGTVIDLRHFGKGTIDFERSGLIRVLR